MRISKRIMCNAKKGKYIKRFFKRFNYLLTDYYRSRGFELRYDKKHNALEIKKV